MAGIAKNSDRGHTHIYGSGPSAWETELRAGGGARLCHESCFDCGTVPPGDPRRWAIGGISLGSEAQTGTAAKRRCSTSGSAATHIGVSRPDISLFALL